LVPVGNQHFDVGAGSSINGLFIVLFQISLWERKASVLNFWERFVLWCSTWGINPSDVRGKKANEQ